ncbi:Peptidase A1 [Macleaya cordata]|uniref:Peptidase A1 n=1 Tax=Macleaya cordata TaxID=56857 RepID=A0A200Q9J2_MACCD|nr:Peptidase A1 [Macleaya cordata]
METPNIATFDPKLSSSTKKFGCDNPICRSIHGTQSTCQDCKPGPDSNCTESCPGYSLEYGSGFTKGTLLSETLTFGDTTIPNLVVGCSDFSINIPAGIAGFGRDPPSLPSQLGLRKFSHCFLSRRFNDTTKSSPLVLYSGSDSDDKDEEIDGISYTPLLRNPNFSTFYYVELNNITVGGKDVEIPENYLLMRSDGNGGAIMDSGTAFTFLEKRIYEKVIGEIDNQVAHYRRVDDVEKSVKLCPCYEVPKEKAPFPKLGFNFKGGAKMDLPEVNTFWFIDNNDTRVACLAIVSGDGSGPISGGPSVILGNFQQQNFYVEYDLKNERLGFRQQDCN